jgi:hypothetical protein
MFELTADNALDYLRRQGWIDAGIRPRKREDIVAGKSGTSTATDYVEGMLVRHDTYGMGRVTDVTGFGALRRVKIRFNTAGEKTFVADKVKLDDYLTSVREVEKRVDKLRPGNVHSADMTRIGKRAAMVAADRAAEAH